MQQLHQTIRGAVVCVLLSACTSSSFKTYDPGLQYRIITHGQGRAVQPGETLKMHLKQIYNDSLLSDTRDSVPFYQVYDSTQLTPASWQIFGQLRKGDSVIFRALSDSAFKTKWPAFAQKGKWLITTMKVEEIFGAAEDWRSDLKKELGR